MMLLINSIGEYFTQDTLILQIWDDEIPNDSHDNKLQQTASTCLPSKQEDQQSDSNTQLIENSYTLGYRIDRYS